MKTNSPLEILFQSGLMSLKTCFCYGDANKNVSCPVCYDEIGRLAKELPMSHHPVSALICRITGEIMDENNQPMTLPNGQIYSEKVRLCFNNRRLMSRLGI
jgi:macrophage erythroblast attacher